MEDISQYYTQFIIDNKLSGIKHECDLIYYFKKGKLHREDGPAIQCKFHANLKKYFLDGEEIEVDSDEKFQKCLKLRIFF